MERQTYEGQVLKAKYWRPRNDGQDLGKNPRYRFRELSFGEQVFAKPY